MDDKELANRLVEVHNGVHPDTCSGTMPKDLREAFRAFMEVYAEKSVTQAMEAVLAAGSIEPVLAGTYANGFWAGHDYFMKYGQLRGD